MTVVKINAISVPEAARDALQERFASRAGTVEQSPGFIRFQLLRPVAGDDRFFVLTEWEDEASFVAWRDSPGRAAHNAQRGETPATGTELLEFDVVLDVAPVVA